MLKTKNKDARELEVNINCEICTGSQSTIYQCFSGKNNLAMKVYHADTSIEEINRQLKLMKRLKNL